MMMMKVANVIIAGSRDFGDYDFMSQKLDEVFSSNNFEGCIITIVSGMARGVDLLGVHYAQEHGMDIESLPANWQKYGRSAGYIRNSEMLGIATHLIAFWDGTSRGTKHMIDISHKKGIPVFVFKY